jgi:hypothetical protein
MLLSLQRRKTKMRVRSSEWLLHLGILGMVMGVGVPSLHAQSKSLVRSGSFEVGPFLGASYGIDKFRVIGGGNVTFAINKYILPYVEYSYFPGIARVSSGTLGGTGAPFTQSYSIPLSDFHGGVHIRIPLRESPVVPYLVFGLGGLTNSSRTVTATYTDASGHPAQIQLPVQGGTNFAVNFGGGIRYYISQRFGVRVEAKGYKPSGTFTDTFGKVEAGFFFQLR